MRAADTSASALPGRKTIKATGEEILMGPRKRTPQPPASGQQLPVPTDWNSGGGGGGSEWKNGSSGAMMTMQNSQSSPVTNPSVGRVGSFLSTCASLEPSASVHPAPDNDTTSRPPSSSRNAAARGSPQSRSRGASGSGNRAPQYLYYDVPSPNRRRNDDARLLPRGYGTLLCSNDERLMDDIILLDTDDADDDIGAVAAARETTRDGAAGSSGGGRGGDRRGDEDPGDNGGDEGSIGDGRGGGDDDNDEGFDVSVSLSAFVRRSSARRQIPMVIYDSPQAASPPPPPPLAALSPPSRPPPRQSPHPTSKFDTSGIDEHTACCHAAHANAAAAIRRDV